MAIQTVCPVEQMVMADLLCSSHTTEKDAQTPCNYRKQAGCQPHLLPQKATVAPTTNPATDWMEITGVGFKAQHQQNKTNKTPASIIADQTRCVMSQ